MQWAEDVVAILKSIVDRSVQNPSWAVGVGVFILVGIFLFQFGRRR
jgi:hypothetical protein